MKTISAISLTQPWASLVAVTAKKIETRSWSTPYRGPIAIHASKGFPAWARELCWRKPFADCLNAVGLNSIEKIPLGVVLATTTLIECVQMGTLLAPDIRHLCKRLGIGHYPESEFGDFTAGRWAWVFGPTTIFKPPVPAKGSLGLWKWNPP